MLIHNMLQVGEKLYAIRKRLGMTQPEAADAAGVSEQTYARLERGTLNIRTDTLIKICEAFHITPDEILTENNQLALSRQSEILAQLDACAPGDRETALRLLEVFLQSLN